MAKFGSKVSTVVEQIEASFGEEHLQDQLTHVCHACGERKRQFEDELGTSEFRSSYFAGEVSEQTGKFIDIISLTH